MGNWLKGDDTGFENSSGHWTNVNRCNIQKVTGHAHTGNGSLQMKCSAAGDMNSANCIATLIQTFGRPCSPGLLIPMSYWVMSAATPRACHVRGIFYTNAGVQISNVDGTNVVNDATTGWTQITDELVAPAGAAYVRISPYIAAAVLNEIHWIDDADIGWVNSTQIPAGYMDHALRVAGVVL